MVAYIFFSPVLRLPGYLTMQWSLLWLHLTFSITLAFMRIVVLIFARFFLHLLSTIELAGGFKHIFLMFHIFLYTPTKKLGDMIQFDDCTYFVKWVGSNTN